MTALAHYFWLSQTIPYYLFNLAYLNIVTESGDCVPELFYMSEKISKSLFLGMPFLVLGCCDYLKYLRELGFKTYGEFIDESYDDIHDWLERSNAIVDIVHDFCNWPEHKKIMFLEKTQKISIHNRELSKNYQHWLRPVMDAIRQIR
jgi:hypothetical protein